MILGCECLPFDHPQHGGGEDHGFAEVQVEDGQHGHLQGQLEPGVDGKGANFRTFLAGEFEQKVVEERANLRFRYSIFLI